MRLSVHHIGGRFGNGGLPLLPAFEQDMVRVYYDADQDCISQIAEKHWGGAAEIHVLPYCLGKEGTGTLHINYDTTSSSLYPINPEYAPYYFFSYNHDFVAADSLRTMEQREVSIASLDSLQEISSGRVPPPDFLSMDVQGAEYAVLQGGARLLRENVLGLVIETGLQPLYEGQRLFDDVRQFLAAAGFHFVKFLSFHDYSPHRAPSGQRGEGFHVLADALFLRRIDDLQKTAADELQKSSRFMKLAFFSMVYGQIEYGLACLAEGMKPGAASITGGGLRYNTFLGELRESCEATPKRYPPTFSEKYTYALSKQRFQAQEAAGPGEGRSAAGSVSERLWLKFIYPNIYRIAGLYRFLVQTLWAAAAARVLPDSRVEKTFRKYRLKEQALLIKKKRVVEFWFSR